MKKHNSKANVSRGMTGIIKSKHRKSTILNRAFHIDNKSNRYDKAHNSDIDSQEYITYKGEIYFSNPPKSQDIKPAMTKESIRKKIRNKETKTILYMLSVIVFISIALSSVAISCMNDIIAIGRSDKQVTVSIPDGANTNQIIKILDRNRLIKQGTFCKIFMKMFTKLSDSGTPVYQNGIYIVSANMGLEGMLNEFKETQETAETVKLVFPEGWTIYQIFEKLDEFDVCDSSYLLTALKETEFNEKFISQINENGRQALKLEGYFFPDTYDFYAGENANSVIKRFLDNFDQKWTDTYIKRANEINMSMDEIITIASIIQKEAANTEQMALVSSVIHNRLEKSSTFPALECNSTKEYIDSLPDTLISSADKNDYSNNYNTYISQGLPPGPICNPGINAIEAALYPKDTDYYYFQHDNSGKIYMASTLSEQNENTMEVLKANSE